MSKEFKIGLLAVISGAILYIGFNFLKGIDLFSSTNQYYAYYENIDGLAKSNPVTLNGLNIGRVREIRIIQEKNNQIEVEIDIDEDVLLGSETQAELVTDLLGSKSVRLKNVQAGQPLESGATIEGVVEQGIFETLMDSTDPIKSTMLKVNTLLNGFSGTRIKLDSMLVEFTETSGQLNRMLLQNQRSILKITNELSLITGVLSDESEGIKPMIENFGAVGDSLKMLELSKTVSSLNQTLASLESTLNTVNNGDGTLGRLMHDDSLYMNLNKSAEDLDRLLIDLREHPKRYVNFSLFGRKDK